MPTSRFNFDRLRTRIEKLGVRDDVRPIMFDISGRFVWTQPSGAATRR